MWFYTRANVQLIRKSAFFLPSSHEEVDESGDRASVGGKTVAQNEAVEAESPIDTEQPAQTDSQGNAVQNGQYQAQLGIADALNEGVGAAHNGECREHPHDRRNEGA